MQENLITRADLKQWSSSFFFRETEQEILGFSIICIRNALVIGHNPLNLQWAQVLIIHNQALIALSLDEIKRAVGSKYIFYGNGRLNACIKENFICLIQKKDCVVFVKDFRPISLTT